MTIDQLLHRMVYLDRDFIAGAYEALAGKAPTTQITKNEGMKVGAQIPFFSAGVSAGESRTFSLSSLGMLHELLPKLEQYEQIDQSAVGRKKLSKTGWLIGELSIFKVEVKERGKEHEQLSQVNIQNIFKPSNPVVASETYFAIHTSNGLKLALITTPDYFSSGLDALTKLYATVIEETTIPVKALVRAFSSRSTFNEWITVPLVILEHQ